MRYVIGAYLAALASLFACALNSHGSMQAFLDALREVEFANLPLG